MALQGDLFDDQADPDASPGTAPSRPGRPARRTGTARTPGVTPESAAALLDAHDDYRVLRRLQPRAAVGPRQLQPGERLTVIVDTETTGLDHKRHEVIELGMVAFVHDAEGRVLDIVGEFSGLQESSDPVPPEITRLTGITDAMLAGQRIDLEAVEAFIAEADLIIAHNAGFDRPFCERLARGFEPKPWACSVKEVPWAEFGFEGSKLGYLVGQSGWFHTGHRATDDCHALLEVLMAPLTNHAGSALGQLLTRSDAARIRIWAEGAPFELKDQLKVRGYRWSNGSDGRPRSWWVEVDEPLAEAEIAFLEGEIYMRRVRPRAQRITACERYKA
ncbi:3'-5' exonuclease [Lichenihabitans sp. Uapishka_5]|uniref:3'-5' exonuclease n=1 Tax=Lichenihabitans sp. Uapishka_5 TaxID=3037302 RepID=UPI0029E824DE|nr:3'-5' exonuclease [Lichenihabitans sp. Uapishka_5]MDX7951796.1 3'-5' exonuclease [Lichenihabitans sp. Uapishka_5]